MSRKNRALEKLYDRLTLEERFKLDIEAHARGDERESRRLVDSCPRRNYTMTDWAFSGRWQTATEIVLAVCMDLCQHMSRLNMIDALRETLPYARTVYQNEASIAYMSGHEAGSRYAWERAGMDGDPPWWDSLEEYDEDEFDPAADEALKALDARLKEVDIMPELLNRLERKVAREAWTIWEAFATFTQGELGLEPEKLIRALFTPALAGVEELKRRKERLGIEPEKEWAAEVGVALSETWGRYLQKVERLSKYSGFQCG